MKTLFAGMCVVLFAASTAMADPYMVYSPFGPQPLSVMYPPAYVAPAPVYAPAPVVSYYPTYQTSYYAPVTSYAPVTTYYPPVVAPTIVAAPVVYPAPVVVRRGLLRPRTYVASPVIAAPVVPVIVP